MSDILVTKPRKSFTKGEKADPAFLAAGRYGTPETVDLFGAEKTIDLSLYVQGVCAEVLSELHPDLVPPRCAKEIREKASLKYISVDRVREIEAQTHHDIIAINRALAEQVSKEAATHINKLKTSADTTQPVRALQLKKGLEIIAETVENLRDIVLEKAMLWIDIPYQDTTHLYDALPTVAGRPLAHYAEMLQTCLDLLKYVYSNSTIGKWADATGNHHSATALGVNGIEIEDAFCKKLGIGKMIAAAQIPGLEFEADVFYCLSRISETVNNIARYIALGRGDDANIFINENPHRKKGSSAMPHKDAKNGNPIAEEQFMSVANYMRGNVMTALSNCEMPYARNLSASSNARINIEDGFKFLDHSLRRMSSVVFYMGIREDVSKSRVARSYGVTTSQYVMSVLTDQRQVKNPMTREDAHDRVGEIAHKAWDSKIPFIDLVLKDKEITSRIGEERLREITDPFKYIGESKNIVKAVYDKFHGVKTL